MTPVDCASINARAGYPARSLNNLGLNDFPYRISHPDLDTLRGETVTSCANVPAGPLLILRSAPDAQLHRELIVFARPVNVGGSRWFDRARKC
jgi:hypothetical protein